MTTYAEKEQELQEGYKVLAKSIVRDFNEEGCDVVLTEDSAGRWQIKVMNSNGYYVYSLSGTIVEALNVLYAMKAVWSVAKRS